MKTPRDVSGSQLVQALRDFGYTRVRQEGSHIRLTTVVDGEFHLSVPNHSPLRLGTFRSILKMVADHHGLTADDLLRKLDL